MNELSSLFAQFEVNGDGSITAQEVEQVLTSMAAVIAPEEADADNCCMSKKSSVAMIFCSGRNISPSLDGINCCGTCLIWWMPITTVGSVEKSSTA